jgi:hypothetical protein
MFPVGSNSAIWLIGSWGVVARIVAIDGAERAVRRPGGL